MSLPWQSGWGEGQKGNGHRHINRLKVKSFPPLLYVFEGKSKSLNIINCIVYKFHQFITLNEKLFKKYLNEIKGNAINV